MGLAKSSAAQAENPSDLLRSNRQASRAYIWKLELSWKTALTMA